MTPEAGRERIETVVIGAGQAGLSVGYHLRRLGRRFVILEGHRRIGDTWRKRWDSLRLFTPARFDALPGLPFPAAGWSFPTKDDMADYLEGYARHFALPVVTGTTVTRVSREGRRYLVETSGRSFEADHVVVAMASYQRPRVPPFARALAPEIVQLHSFDYRNPAQLAAGAVLIVGAGNSGAEIARELAPSHRVMLSGRDTGSVPFDIHGLSGKLFAPFVLRVLFHRILTIRTPVGRKARPAMIGKGGPLIRVKPRQLAAAGIERVPRVLEVRGGQPVLEDGRTLDVANVIWCTGFHPGFSWIDLPVFGGDGEPVHDGGVVTGEPGLYFVGLHFLYAFSSTMIHGVGRDAQRIAKAIDLRVRVTMAESGATPVTAALAGSR